MNRSQDPRPANPQSDLLESPSIAEIAEELFAQDRTETAENRQKSPSDATTDATGSERGQRRRPYRYSSPAGDQWGWALSEGAQ